MAQYQHYIPQFILRNFSHPYNPPKSASRKKSQRRGEKGKYRGDKVLNVADLTSDEPQLIEAPVSRWFGQDDMYNDVFDTIKAKKDVEQELSKLESHTAIILHKVKKAHESGDAGICLTRVERNMLRKFLFIMKYRGPRYFEKYASEDASAYKSEDKHLLRDYMAAKKITRPRDVWLDNLRAILHLDMDPEGKWIATLGDVMFPADAKMLVCHVQASYIAFCTPAEKDQEFILTDQAYNLFEGPTHNTFMSNTEEYIGDTYLCFHEFGPVSPRLIIILRSGALPEALEDRDPEVKEARRQHFYGATAQFPEPDKIKSILEDLPVAKATNSYSTVVNDRLELAPGETGTFSSRDKFTFRFWPVSATHVDIINSIFLDNLLRCKSVVFNSTDSFRHTLETYMTRQDHGFKRIAVGEYGAKTTRLACLEKLTVVLKKLGVEDVPIYFDLTGKESEIVTRSFDDEWLEVVMRTAKDAELPLSGDDGPFWQTYRLLGGTGQTFLKDLEQSWRLYQFKSKMTEWTIGLENTLRQNVMACVLDIILNHHPRRVWLYVKHVRWMTSKEYAVLLQRFIGTGAIYQAKTEALFKPEIEDFIVQERYATSWDYLCELIYFAIVHIATGSSDGQEFNSRFR